MSKIMKRDRKKNLLQLDTYLSLNAVFIGLMRIASDEIMACKAVIRTILYRIIFFLDA
jgi:hypothetical protein